MPPKIRDFTESDIGSVVSLARELQKHEAELFDRMKPPDEIGAWYIRRLRTNCAAHKGKILVAELEGDVVGYAVLLTDVSSDEAVDERPYSYAMVLDLAVAKEMRRKGVGTALLDECEQRARAANARWLRISVLAGNEQAIAIYHKFGFQPLLTTMEKALD